MTASPISTPPIPRSGAAAFAHVVLTRFNVRYVEDPDAPSIGVDPTWLAERFELFERYCLPSLIAQTEQNFIWLIFFDEATPEPFRQRVLDLPARHPPIRPVFCKTLPLSLVKDSIRSAITGQPDWLLTSRVDNDDGLHPGFVAALQKGQSLQQAEVLNFPLGIIVKGDRAYRRRDESNAFISLSEPLDDFESVYSITRHIYAGESYPLKQLVEDPMWLQVIHASNISNRVRGWRVPMAAASEFPGLALAAEQPSAENGLAILAENMSLFLLRASRDIAVKYARRAARLIGVDLRRKPAPRQRIPAAP
jgi:hypothetical protein